MKTIFEVIKDFEKTTDYKTNLDQLYKKIDTNEVYHKTPPKLVPTENHDNGGQTTAHEVIASKYIQEVDKVSLLEKIFARGVSVESLDNQNRTPLHTAARFGCFGCIKYLITEAHAKVDAQCQYGRTPLHKAAWHWRDLPQKKITRGITIYSLDELKIIKNYIDCISFLTANGASWEIEDADKPSSHKIEHNQKKNLPVNTPFKTTPLTDAQSSLKIIEPHLNYFDSSLKNSCIAIKDLLSKRDPKNKGHFCGYSPFWLGISFVVGAIAVKSILTMRNKK